MIGLDQVRNQLSDKRQYLLRWLRGALADEPRTALGPVDTAAVQRQLETVEQALAKAEAGTLHECVVCHESVEHELIEMDYTACVCLEHFSDAEIRQLEGELELATVVQRALLPQQIPAIPGADLAAFSRPAQIVGGDYFDFVHFRDGCHGLAIADVSGHGVAASLLMASVQTALHTLAPLNDSPAAVMREINRLFSRNVHFTTFVTMFLGRLDPEAGTLEYCSAGHNPPLVVRASGAEQVSWLDPTGAAIGLVDANPLADQTVSLGRGDVLLLYTDGVTEAARADGEQWGTARLTDTIRSSATAPAAELIRGVREALRQFTADAQPDDDMTLVACRLT